jgi:hypothetical protein
LAFLELASGVRKTSPILFFDPSPCALSPTPRIKADHFSFGVYR